MSVGIAASQPLLPFGSLGIGVSESGGHLGVGAGAGAGPHRPSTLEASRAQASFMSRKRSDELALANMVIAGFHPFAGAPREVVDEEEMEGRRDGGRACNALELAIVTESKRFVSVSGPSCSPRSCDGT